MEAQVRGAICDVCGDRQSEEDKVIRKGPWTMEEDSKLTQYVTVHGEGHWNTAAHCAGLKRTGKSCRLRWLNYLRPDVKRGNISLKEQLLILQLHSRWGNRWSKMAQYLPGRTDNEIKNYWRTRVQKLAKHLNCDINSQQFRDAMHHIWMPRLIERINATSSPSSSSPSSSSTSSSSLDHPTTTITNNNYNNPALVVQNIPKPSLVWVNPDPSHDSFDTHVTSNGMQNGSDLIPESESWNSWYGLQANGSYMDSSGLESFWINEDNSWLSTIDDNANT